MDGSRFDELARRVATGVTRRALLKSTLSGVAGGAIALVSSRSADARHVCRADGVVCRKPAECCANRCGSKDSTGRRRCGCTVASDCPAPPVCQSAVCTHHTCSTVGDDAQIGAPCGKPASCDPLFNMEHLADTCDAKGLCQSGLDRDCGQFVCGESACLTSCQSDDECIPGAHCEDDNVCRADLAAGSACDGPGDCLSGHCVDGVCCDTECTEECHRCDGTNRGTCSPETGTPCDGGTCVGGSCCPADLVCGSGNATLCDCSPDTCCFGICVELGTPVNCSGCGDACGTGFDCCESVCTPLGTLTDCLSCGDACSPTDTACCPTGCTDLTSNILHCGTCGTSCISGSVGSPGCCDGTCTDLLADVNHCGSCDADPCTGTTPDCCGGTCADLDTSDSNCGACFYICDTSKVQYSSAVDCIGGTCVATACQSIATLLHGTCCLNERVCGSGDTATCCGSGETCCSGTCADTSISTSNCGSCGNACPDGVSCAGGTCAAGSFGDPCGGQIPCSYTWSGGSACLNGHCCIPPGVACVSGQITFSGECCSDTSKSCPSIGTCP